MQSISGPINVPSYCIDDWCQLLLSFEDNGNLPPAITWAYFYQKSSDNRWAQFGIRVNTHNSPRAQTRGWLGLNGDSSNDLILNMDGWGTQQGYLYDDSSSESDPDQFAFTNPNNHHVRLYSCRFL